MINKKKFDSISQMLSLSKNVFIPNLTSKLSTKVAIKNIGKRKNILDLGCGSGIIGICVLSKKKKINLYCSDVHKASIENSKKNFKKFGFNPTIKHGDLFKPWKNKKFDYIINDVSGIANRIARISPWFSNKVPCNTGKDGTDLTLSVIRQSKDYLKKNGILQFAMLSLSNTKKITFHAKKNFKIVKLVEKKAWFLPDKMYKFKKLLISLKKKKYIDFEEKFGKIICYTSIIICKNI